MTDEIMGVTIKLLPILTFPNEGLRTIAEKVTEFDEDLKQLVLNMIVTMVENNGIGLAAPQVGIAKRVITIGLDEPPLVLINPIIIDSKGTATSEEGCLSVPGFCDTIKRHSEIIVSFQNLEGEVKESTASGMLAIVVQHEIDHLNGKLFVDYLSPFKQNRAREKSKKNAKKMLKLIK
jgi:peptide deformylase